MKYRHKKRGTLYSIVGIGIMQTTKPIIDGSRVVIYLGHLADYWVRSYKEFHDGRFEQEPETRKSILKSHDHSSIIYAYFKSLKRAREYGLRITCPWEEGIFRLYKGDTLIGASVDITEIQSFIEKEISDTGF